MVGDIRPSAGALVAPDLVGSVPRNPHRAHGQGRGPAHSIAHDDSQEIEDRAGIHDKPAVHEEFAQRQFRIADKFEWPASVEKPDRDQLPLAVAEALARAVGVGNFDIAALYDPRRQCGQQLPHAWVPPLLTNAGSGRRALLTCIVIMAVRPLATIL